MTVAFHSNQLGLRGTEIALYDYAFYNQQLLGNESIIYCPRRGEVHPAVHRKFAAQFECVFYDEFRDLESISSRRDVRHTYFIKAGPRDGLELAATRNLVHAVFPTAAKDFHGDRFAFVSEWLADECSNCRLPFVPHMVDLPDHARDLRAELNVPEDAVVFGCYGGKDSFDIGFVREVVALGESLVPHAYFLFMNIECFCSHSRVRFLPGTSCRERKVSFINTCDAMLHARGLGESLRARLRGVLHPQPARRYLRSFVTAQSFAHPGRCRPRLSRPPGATRHPARDGSGRVSPAILEPLQCIVLAAPGDGKISRGLPERRSPGAELESLGSAANPEASRRAQGT